MRLCLSGDVKVLLAFTQIYTRNNFKKEAVFDSFLVLYYRLNRFSFFFF